MKDKKPTTESYDQWEAWAQRTYRTGGTQPPKNHGGLIAFLLVMIIFLCGISTALGLMNIRLFRQLTAQANEDTAPVVFSQSADAAAAESASPLGFTGQTIPDFWQNYHDLPQGIYVTDVIDGSDAYSKGIRPGDILTAFNGVSIADTEALNTIVAEYQSGGCVTIHIYRSGQDLELSIILG